MKRVFSMLLGLLLLLSCLPALAEDFDPATEAVTIIEQALAGDVDAYYDRFADSVQTQLPKESIANVGDDLAAMFGAVVSLGAPQAIGNAVTVPLEMENGNLLAQVVFDGEQRIIGFGFVPAPSTETEDIPLTESEEEVTVGPKGLYGILTLPENAEGPLPAVVLVHGSGPNDHDESLGDIRIFRDLAEGLSAQGIAVLRYDKRTYAMNQGTIDYTMDEIENMTTYDETIEDAVAAAALLREDDRIDPERVFILGHSQGGMLANRIEAEGANARGLIIFAGTLRHLTEVLADQLEVIDAGSGALESEVTLARALPEMTEAEAREKMVFGVPAYTLWEEAQHDLTAIAAANDVPMLILQGTEDANVYADVDYVLWQEFAEAHPEKDIEFKLYEGLEHTFTRNGKVDAPVIDDIAAWVLSK